MEVQRQALRRGRVPRAGRPDDPGAGPALGGDGSPFRRRRSARRPAHLGESIIAWALEVRWDIAHGLATTSWPSTCRSPSTRTCSGAGVGKQGGVSLMQGVPIGDAMISVTSPLPAPAGSEMTVAGALAVGPGRPEGHASSSIAAPTPRTASEGIIASALIDPADLASGGIEVAPARPAGLGAVVRRGGPRDQLRHPGPGRPPLPERRGDRATGRDRLTGPWRRR